MDDFPVYINGRVVSANQQRQREDIEQALRAVEHDLLTTAALLEAAQEREDVRHHNKRMVELHRHLARLRSEHKTADKRGLIYKVTMNARLDARRR